MTYFRWWPHYFANTFDINVKCRRCSPHTLVAKRMPRYAFLFAKRRAHSSFSFRGGGTTLLFSQNNDVVDSSQERERDEQISVKFAFKGQCFAHLIKNISSSWRERTHLVCKLYFRKRRREKYLSYYFFKQKAGIYNYVYLLYYITMLLFIFYI